MMPSLAGGTRRFRPKNPYHPNPENVDLNQTQADLKCPNCGDYLFVSVLGVIAGDGMNSRGAWRAETLMTARIVTTTFGLIADRMLASVRR
jgi:hypothetical protein